MFELNREGAERLAFEIKNGSASNEEAYKYGMAMLSAAGESIVNIDDAISRSEPRDRLIELLGEVRGSKSLALTAESLFSKYPVISLAAKGLYGSLQHSYLSLVLYTYQPKATGDSKLNGKCTYFVSNPLTGLIKIGRTKDLKSRLTSIQCGAGSPLDILLVLDEDKERLLHRKFSKFRVHGEWFDDSDGEIKAYIKAEKIKGVAHV